MKSALIGIFALIISLITFNACKDDLNLVGNFKETPVVIGALDQNDTVHYIKLTRAFIGDGQTSSLDIAQIPDSSYFNNVVMTIKEKNGNGAVLRTFVLHDTLIENKSTNGVFYAPEQKVYVFYTSSSAPLLIDKYYALDINIDNGRIIISGETQLVKDMTFNPTVTNFNSNFKFADNPASYKPVNFKLDNVGTAVKFSSKLIFNYREYTTFPSVFEDKSIVWDLGQSEKSGNSIALNVVADGESFYKMIKNGITSNAGIEKRRYTSIEVFTTGGATELSNYIDLSQPSSSLAQSKPEYTNLTVNNGLKVIGIFSARQTVHVTKPATGAVSYIRALDQKSVHELCNGVITGSLLFCSDHTADATATPSISYCP